MRRSSALLVVVALLGTGVAGAQTGNVDPAQRHAWAENAGWLDLRPEGGGVTVMDSWLTGYAWAENLGWVKLGSDGGGPYANTSATNWGVNRDPAGNLSGWAWAENAGWIDFGATGGGVTVDAGSLQLSGYAWSENAGWISFRGPGYGVGLLSLPVPALALLGLVGLAGGLALLGTRRLRRRQA